ncbi:E3 ubiquitin-protein ligase TRIM17-like isoform X8 [Ambystoma mexicanum]|uniref:E3 ubiquitin-protein ligase TRIM17-like isoform X8 n=1 Tax=Ambystoma mexicanum TaxID=8296 RepID=UPI0037E80E37
MRPPQEENLCAEHEEKLKLFCEDDQRLICVVCSMSRDHKPHTVLPIREAAQEYKDKLYSHMEHLKKELKDLHEWIEEEKRNASELKANIMNQREKILSTFDHLKQFLEKEKQQLLSRLEKEQEENMKKIQEKLTQLEKQQSTHRDLITELESKCQQQDVDLLKDVKSVLGSREQGVHNENTWRPSWENMDYHCTGAGSPSKRKHGVLIKPIFHFTCSLFRGTRLSIS